MAQDVNYCALNPLDASCASGASIVPKKIGFFWGPLTATTTTSQPTPGMIVTTTMPMATPWYKTWWGVGGLAIAGVFAVKKLSKPKKA